MRRAVSVVLLLGGLWGCTETTDIIGNKIPALDPDASLVDAGTDASTDAAADASTDAATDASTDADVDADLDADSDAAVADPDDVLSDIGFPQSDSEERINDTFDQLFFGDPAEQSVYREPEDDAAYIEDIINGDVRTDAMGYGMFVAVQLDEQEVFDKLWTWAKRYMLYTEAPREGLLAWSCSTAGTNCEMLAVTDATSWIITSLFMAEALWSTTGVHEYEADANMLVDAMVLTEERNGGIEEAVQNMFDVDTMLPRRWSQAGDHTYLNTDYLMPAFYDYWSRWRSDDSEFWSGAAQASTDLLKLAAVADNGLIPVEIDVDGEPSPDVPYHDEVSARALLNRWFITSWMGKATWIRDQSRTLLDFFLAQQEPLVSSYRLNGAIRGDRNTPAHIALTATAAAVAEDTDTYGPFLQTLVDEPIPEGDDRYYQGMLYLITFLAASGNIEAGEP